MTTAVVSLMQRLRPQRLRHQMLLMLAAVMLLALAVLYEVSSWRLGSVAYDGARQWAESVARTAAGAGGTTLAARDYPGMAETLRDLASLPGVLRIDVVDDRNAPLLSVLHESTGRLTTTFHAADMPLPGPDAPRSRPLRLGHEDAVQVWAPLGPGGALGSVGVSFALDGERNVLQQLRYDAVLGIAAVALVTLLATHLLLQRALAPLQRLARFSRALALNRGATLQQQTGSQEVAEVNEALNEASTALAAQWAELKLARDRMQALLNGRPDAVVGIDPDGKVALISPSAASVLGLDTSRPADVTLERLVPGQGLDDPETRTLEGMYLRSSGVHVARFEADARRVDGTVFPADVSLSRTEIGGVAHYTCVVRDITEQRMNASVLNLYSRALECTTNGVVISDMTLPGQPVFYANPAFYRITGYEPGEAIGRNCDFLQRDDRDQPELDTLRQAVADGQSASVVLRNYRKDGSLFFNELSIAPVPSPEGRAAHYVGVLNDVTDRERTRLAIAERSARLNAVFDLSPDGFVVFDREGELVYTNRAFIEMTGLDLLADGAGANLADFDREFATLGSLSVPCRPVAEVLSLAHDGAVETLHIERPQYRVLARAVRHQADGAGETILYFRDVTRETEVDRMKSEFLTTAAHELRTPMVSVFGFTELLLHRPVDEERRRDMLTTIHRQASLLINMVNELLDLARIEARQGKDMKPEACSLGRLLELAMAPFQAHGADRLHVVLDHADAQLWVDPEKMNRVFGNVVSNAFKYSPDGGEIEVRTIDGLLRGSPAVGVRVHDHGIGMSPDQLRRVFERFYRADPSGNIPGTGLGMSLVKEITELQDGQVQIDSVFGQGTTVTLWFPLLAERRPLLALALEEPDPAHAGSLQ